MATYSSSSQQNTYALEMGNIAQGMLLQNVPFYYGQYQYIPQAPAMPAPAPQPASPTAAASSLQILIASIRPAQDGQVITAEDHNALRTALVAIANRLGLGTVTEEITVTVVPQFLPGGYETNGTPSEWTHQMGVATQGSETSVNPLRGWMEVELPEGARIKKMVAYATATLSGTGDNAGKLKIRLVRQKITDDASKALLAEISVASGKSLSEGSEADITVPSAGGAGVTAIEEYRKVNNREFKYLLTAEINSTSTVSGAKLTCVQIVCGNE